MSVTAMLRQGTELIRFDSMVAEGHFESAPRWDWLARTLRGLERPLLQRLHRLLVESVTQRPCHLNIVGKAVGADCRRQDYRPLDLGIVRCHGVFRVGRMNGDWWLVYARGMVFVTAQFQKWCGIRWGVLRRRYTPCRQHGDQTEDNREARHKGTISHAPAPGVRSSLAISIGSGVVSVMAIYQQ